MRPITEKVSRHFRWSEVVASQTAARLGIANTPTLGQCANIEQAAHCLDAVRDLLRVPVMVSSWFRSLALNKARKGARRSDHLEGWAIDFVAPAFGSPAEIVRAIVRSGIPFHKLILEFPNSAGGGWVHISFRPEMAGLVMVTHDGVSYEPFA